MSISAAQAVIIIAVCALCTFATRALTFIIFGERPMPQSVKYLGKILPMAVMTTLVIYCLRDVRFTTFEGFLPELISAVVVVALHLWRRNTLLSIVGGTACYMLLVQCVFI